MLIQQPFDVAMAIRARRRQLKLRQIELAKEAKVGREWLVDLEHGKPTVELGLVLRTLETLGLEVAARRHRGAAALDRPADRRRHQARRGPGRIPAAPAAQGAPRPARAEGIPLAAGVMGPRHCEHSEDPRETRGSYG